jgi:tetratricopeptide (TPR) repeat protein
LDWTARQHLPALERFLLHAEEAAWRGRSIPKIFDEVMDVRWDYSVAQQLGDTMPSFVGIDSVELPSRANAEYWLDAGVEAAEFGERDNARGYLHEAINLRRGWGKRANDQEAHVHFLLGVLDVKDELYKQAKQQFEKCVELNPRHEDARTNLEALSKWA